MHKKLLPAIELNEILLELMINYYKVELLLLHIREWEKSRNIWLEPVGNGYSDSSSHKSNNKLPEWFTKKNVVSDNKYLETSTMNHNIRKYKWYKSWNNRNDAWGFHWKDDHRSRKRSTERKSLFNLMIMIQMKSSIYTIPRPSVSIIRNNNRGVGMTDRKMISFTWIILNKWNDSSR